MEFISYLFIVLPYVIAFILALGLCAVSILFINSPLVAMGVMTAIYLVETSLMGLFALNLGLTVYLPDILVLFLLPAFGYRLVMLDKFNAIPRAWWVLGIVWLGLFIWGLTRYGTSSGVDFRLFFYVWLGAAYLSTFEYDEVSVRKLLTFLVVLGVGMCAIAYYRWTMGAVDDEFFRELKMLDTTGTALLRVVSANGAFILSCSLLVVAFQAVTERNNQLAWLLAAIFGITVIAMQHRTVWVATVAGFVALAFALQRIRSEAGSKLFSLVLGIILVLVVIVASGRFQGAVESVGDQAERATSTTSGTFVGRVGGWQALLKQWVESGSLPTYLVGHPFGGGYERYESDFSGHKVGYAPHNFYVQLLYRGGLIGLISFLWAVGQGIRTLLIKLRRKDDAMAPLLFAMLVAQLVYLIPYGIHYGQMILYGLLLAMITSEKLKHPVANPALSISMKRKRLRLG